MGSVKILQTNMKLAVIGLTTFLASISLAQDVVNEKAGNSIKVDTRAPSTYQNCNCQCDSYTWSDGNYIPGSALCSCRDVQRSNSVVDSYGNLRYYSFEACTTPPRNQCTNYGWGSYGGNGGNYGDGDFPYCSNSGSNQGWSSGSSNSNYRPGGSTNYRPGGSSSYRPGGSGWSSGSNCRHSGCSNYRPSGGSS